MNYDNEMTIKFKGIPENEAFARTSVSIFVAQLNPTLSELNDIKTAVSEAVTNAIIHGYENMIGEVLLECKIKNSEVYIKIEDKGKGIENIKEAMTPLYTSKPNMERSGMGFTVMETFMDKIEVSSEIEKGTTIKMRKTIGEENSQIWQGVRQCVKSTNL